ncbi:MAG: DUF4252 domain-containing protein [Cytophagales bacterium]|nr:DUF4252 domain-containing protein [Cytophagales bacterium]
MHRLSLLILSVLLSTHTVFAQSDFFNSVSRNFREATGVNRISIPGSIFKMVGSGESQNPEIEIFSFVEQMSFLTIPNRQIEKKNLNFNKLLQKAESGGFDEYLRVTEKQNLIRLYVKEDKNRINNVLFIIKNGQANTAIIDFTCDLPKKKLREFVKTVRSKNLENGNFNF